MNAMSIDGAFDAFQASVNADPGQVTCARARRDTFKRAFRPEPDVNEIFGSGSLARSTQLKPVHDVDLVVVFDADEHPTWGQPGESSAQALLHAQGMVTRLLGGNGQVDQLVRETRVADRNRSVKCFIDPPDAPDAFTVDVMPTLRLSNGHLLLPSAHEGSWSQANPEYLISEVAAKQQQWSYFRPVVRMLKDWRLHQGFQIKSLVMEVLALKCLPTTGNRASAIASFFTSAAVETFYGIEDPAGYCGPIQRDLDVTALSEALGQSRTWAALACTAAGDGDVNTAKSYWREVFGAQFPGPDKGPGLPVVAPTPGPRPVKDAPQG
jgi:hypothetical protein